MRRVLGWMLALTLLTGGVAACGSTGSDKASDTTAASGSDTTAAPTDNGGSDSGNAEVVAYCKAVDEYVAKVKAAQADPSKAAALATDAQDLAQKATALATGLSSEDAQKVADCTKKSTDALTGG